MGRTLLVQPPMKSERENSRLAFERLCRTVTLCTVKFQQERQYRKWDPKRISGDDCKSTQPTQFRVSTRTQAPIDQAPKFYPNDFVVGAVSLPLGMSMTSSGMSFDIRCSSQRSRNNYEHKSKL